MVLSRISLKQDIRKFLPRRITALLRKIKYSSGRYNVISVFSYCEKTCIDYKTIDSERKTTAVAPHFFDSPAPIRQSQVPMPETYVAIMGNADIIGASNIILAGNYAIYNAPMGENIDYTDSALFLDAHNHCNIGPNTLIYWRRGNRRLKCAVSLVCNYSHNYYHFVLECIPKLFLLERCGIPSDIPILLDSCVKKIPQFLSYIDALAGDRTVLFVEHRERVNIDKLYVLSPVNIIPPNYIRIDLCKPTDNLFDELNIRKLRKKMLGLSNRSSAMPRKIFISRRNQTNRAYNEQEIHGVLNRFGFISIAPELMSLAEQIQTFASADWIVAASGAALTNIVYCHPGCRVLVLTGIAAELSIFSNIADMLGVQMTYLSGKADGDEIQTGFYIDPSMVERYLKLEFAGDSVVS